jgi:uncharacterized protein DUF3237
VTATRDGGIDPRLESSSSGVALPAPSLELVCHVEAELAEPLVVGDVPTGTRRVIPIAGGVVQGPQLQGVILSGGADWQLVDAQGTAIIDTRYLMRTDDGGLIVISTQGFRHGAPEVLARIAAGEPVAPDEYYFRVAARLETAASAPHAWVNHTVFVAIASRGLSSVGYDLYAVR